MDAENIRYDGCSQRDSAEHKGVCESASLIQPDMEGKGRCTAAGSLGKILEKDNLNRAFKKVKANKGSAGELMG